MNKKAIAAMVLFLSFGLNTAFCVEDPGLQITIDIKESFSEGETISFTYEITSIQDTNISFHEYVSCPIAPLPLLEEKNALAGPEQALHGEYEYMTVTEQFEPQECTAGISIESPVEKREWKKFAINTKPSFSLEIETCEDPDCARPSNIFLKGQTIHIKFTTGAEKITLTAQLKKPGGTTEEISLPAQVLAEENGTHELTVKATAEGYKDRGVTLQFGVIEKEPEIKNLFEEETEKKEPREEQTKTQEPGWQFYFFIGAVMTIIAFIAAYNIMKRKKKK